MKLNGDECLSLNETIELCDMNNNRRKVSEATLIIISNSNISLPSPSLSISATSINAI